MSGRRGRPLTAADSHRPQLRPGRGPRVRAEGELRPPPPPEEAGTMLETLRERLLSVQQDFTSGWVAPRVRRGGGTRSPAGERGKQVTGREEEEGTGGCGVVTAGSWEGGTRCGEGEAALLGGWGRRERGRLTRWNRLRSA